MYPKFPKLLMLAMPPDFQNIAFWESQNERYFKHEIRMLKIVMEKQKGKAVPGAWWAKENLN